ncbi:MAG: arsenate reductase (glutaredoxin) [Alphaproteobacteria bacterium]
MSLTIYHNPRCSKSRQTLALIEAAGQSPEIVLYLQDPLTESDIKTLLERLGYASARDMMRRGEASYKEMKLKDVIDEYALIRAMANDPKLIERPIVDNGVKAIMGRPPENVQALL